MVSVTTIIRRRAPKIAAKGANRLNKAANKRWYASHHKPVRGTRMPLTMGAKTGHAQTMPYRTVK